MTLVLNGTSGLTFNDATTLGTSPGAWQSVQATNFTAVAGNAYPVNTTSGAITVTLPASPTAGQSVVLTDYAGTWGTNAVTINPNGLKLDGLTANGIVNAYRSTVSLVYLDTTQGWITYSNVVPFSNYSTNILILAGGGGAGGSSGDQVAGGGGAGAGGYLYYTNQTVTKNTAYTITIGSGGTGGTIGVNGTQGGNSSISGLSLTTSVGGGAGRHADDGNVSISNGGSGGGASGSSGGAAGSGTAGQGNNGGAKNDGNAGSFAGGGGGGIAASASGRTPGAGSSNSISGTAVTYAAGGYGQGTSNFISAGVSGTANTGNGGNGAPNGVGTGGNGGSGVIIISYSNPVQIGSGGTVTSYTSSGTIYWVHTFTTSGTYTA